MNGVVFFLVFFLVFFCISIYHKKIQILIQILSFQKCVSDTVLYLIQYYVFDTVSGVNTNPWLLHVDDLIIMSKAEDEIDKALKDILVAGFDIKCEGSLSEYLGIKIQRTDSGDIHLKQLTIMKQILQDLGFNQRT